MMKKKKKRVMSKQERLVERENTNYLTTDEFVERYARSLRDYLVKTIGKESNHIGDLSAHTCAFSEAFYSITTGF